MLSKCQALFEFAVKENLVLSWCVPVLRALYIKVSTDIIISLTALLQRGIQIFLKIGKTMKELFKKIIQTSAAIIISLIAVHGIVYAQQVYCGTIVDACIPASNRISGGYTSGNSWATPPSYHRNIQLLSNICSNNFLADFGAGNTCCETDRCDSYKQAKYFSLSFFQDFYPHQKNVSFFDADISAQTTFEPYSLPTSLKAVPIYIATQSIVC
jgi:hypothetical protein